MLKQIICFFVLVPGVLISAEFKNTKQPDIRMVLSLHFSELQEDKEAQLLLYNYSQRVLRRLEAVSYYLKQKIDCKTVTSLKNNDLDSFIASVCDKCARKNYDRVGRMHDMARARVSATTESQIQKLMRIVNSFSDKFRFKEIKIIKPRRPFRVNNLDDSAERTVFGYPRFHVVFEDQNGFMVEWQFETRWTGKLCETPGDIFPKNFPTPKSYRNDLHDVAYRLFFKLVENTKEDGDLDKVLKFIGLEEFLHNHDVIIALAHIKSNIYTEQDLAKDLQFLHEWAARIISAIIIFYGPDFVLKQME